LASHFVELLLSDRAAHVSTLQHLSSGLLKVTDSTAARESRRHAAAEEHHDHHEEQAEEWKHPKPVHVRKPVEVHDLLQLPMFSKEGPHNRLISG
jgi:hypothetical protein